MRGWVLVAIKSIPQNTGPVPLDFWCVCVGSKTEDVQLPAAL